MDTEQISMPTDFDLALGPELRIFDPQYCEHIDLEWLTGAVEEQGITVAEVDAILGDGLVRRWQSPNGVKGFLLYTERQIRVAKTLKHTGRYTDAEMRNIFDDWHMLIELCIIDHLAYDSFEIENYDHFRRRSGQDRDFFKTQLDLIAKDEVPWMSDEQKASTEQHYMFWSKWHDRVMAYDDEELPHLQRLNWRKALAHQRWCDELTRMNTADNFGLLVEQGYSADIVFKGYQLSGDGRELTHLDWAATLNQFKTTRDEGKLFPLRTPDFTITESGIVFPVLPTPESLQQWHEKYDLGTLRELLTRWGPKLWTSDLAASGRAQCIMCQTPFERTRASRTYCSETCRNRARQRRFRINNPDKIEAAQARYYEPALREKAIVKGGKV